MEQKRILVIDWNFNSVSFPITFPTYFQVAEMYNAQKHNHSNTQDDSDDE